MKLHTSVVTILTLTTLALGPATLQAAEAFPNPAGGWTYLYTGDQLQTGEPALDGTWTHNNGSDEFNGDEIGGVLDPVNDPANRPGGANLLTEGDTQYLRMQDTGDPRDYDPSDNPWNDPGSQRKIYFGHYLSQDMPEEDTLAILDNGVTLTFRARIPTPAKAGGPLDPLHRDGQNSAGTYPDNGVVPYPDGGDGYLTSDGAKGNFVIRQIGDSTQGISGGAIALSLTVATDTPGGNPNSGVAGYAGVTMNERSGPAPSGNVDFGEGSGENNFALDPTDWHEFWICIRKTRNPAKADATHDVFVFRDGNLVATSHKVTAGTGSDLDAGSFIATGGSATPQNWALDVDWYGYKQGFVLPEGGQVPPDVIVTPVGGTLFYTASGGLEVDVEANMPGSTIPDGGFQVILNGQDISNQLVVSGTGTDAFRTATYNGLTQNMQYTAVVRVTDSAGLTTEIISDFDTFLETGLAIESEDYNDSVAGWLDPLPGDTSIWVGTPDIDYVDLTPETLGPYRVNDAVDMDNGNDVTRQKFIDVGATDYQVTDVQSGEWLNFTRTFPSAVLTPYLRAGAGADGLLQLDLVTSDRTQPNQTTKPLGLFLAAQTRTVNTYRYMPLTDAFGQPRSLAFSGVETVRLTATDVSSDVNHNYMFFADAGATASTLPWAIAVSPAPGAENVPVDATVNVSLVDGNNAVNPASIQMKFDGADVSAALTKTDTTPGADVSYNPGGLAEGTTHTVELTYADTAGGSDTRTWSFTVEGTPPAGAKIAWVSFHPADDTPAADAAAAGFTSAPDVAYTQLLRDNNYEVTRIVTSGTPDTALLNTFDVVIIGRSVNSGDYQDAPETAAWNGITAPMMILGGYVLRDSRLGFTTGGTIPDTAGPVSLAVARPGHPIFAGVALNADHTMVNTYAEPVTFNGTVQRGISVNTNPLDGGGTVLATIGTAGDPAFGGMVIGEWTAGAVINAGADTLGGHRLVFLTGSREVSGLTSQGSGIYDLSADGAQMFLNAVAYMAAGSWYQASQFTGIRLEAGQVVIEWTGAGTLQEAEAVTGPWNNVAGATSPHTVGAPTGNKFYRLAQ